MKLIITLCLLLSIGFYAKSQGIKFEEKLSWNEIKAKAKNEKKYIFIDVMATWCKPCKIMDEKTFSQPNVGTVMSESFISVRVQMDKTSSDNEYIRSWYVDAEKMEKDYNIASYPTYLFFSPEGKLVHRGGGVKIPEFFIPFAKEALDREQQYYTLREKFMKGKMDDRALPIFVQKANKAKDSKIEIQAATQYINNYLMKLPEDSLYQLDYIDIISKYVTAKDKKAVAIFYPNGFRVNQLVPDTKYGSFRYSDFVMGKVISEEIIFPALYNKGIVGDYKQTSPDWKGIEQSILNKYNRKTMLWSLYNAKKDFYKGSKQWEELGKTYVEYFDALGVDPKGAMAINTSCWDDIFLKVNDKEVLKKASGWMEVVVKANPKHPAYIDTYANLLYKSGQKEKAVEWQKVAVQIVAENAAKHNVKPNPSFANVLKKMENGEPTW